jgi:1,2-phenylacetyl-CoA epoxidase PaaB subunit
MQAAVKKNVFEVFAQIEPGGPISHIGNLNAPGIALAKVYARRIYDEERWSEMWVVPRDEIVVVHPDDSSPFESEVASPATSPREAAGAGASDRAGSSPASSTASAPSPSGSRSGGPARG